MDLKESRTQSATEGEWYDDVRFALLRALASDNMSQTVLDYGCGAGGLSRRWASHTGQAVTGYDPALQADEIAGLRTVGVAAHSSIDELSDQTFGLVLLMDVLEHVDDPVALLQDACSHTAAGGKVIITVPAYRWLWSSHDVALGHVDRYTKPRLNALCATAGPAYRTVRSGYAFPSLLAGAAPVRLLERLKRRHKEPGDTSQMADVSPRLARVLGRLGRADATVVGAVSPFGLTCVQVLERTS